MAKKSAGDERLRRLGRAAYGDIESPARKPAPIPERMERTRNPNPKRYPGIEFAREPLSTREIASSINVRCRVRALQHVVKDRDEDRRADGRLAPPWQYRVVAECKARLRFAAVKAERMFLELDLCPKCAKAISA